MNSNINKQLNNSNNHNLINLNNHNSSIIKTPTNPNNPPINTNINKKEMNMGDGNRHGNYAGTSA